MGKREAGPEGPANAPEPFENETPDAARINDNPDCDCVQPCTDALFAQYGNALEGIEPGKIIYDSGWDHLPKMSLRVIMAEGPPNADLDRFLQGLGSGPEERGG